jgi:hypothetical protein
MFKKGISSTDHKTTKISYKYEDFFCLVDTYYELISTTKILKEAVHRQEPGKSEIFEDEFEDISTIYEELSKLPKTENDIYAYDLRSKQDIDKLNKYIEKSQLLQKQLDQVKFNALIKAFHKTEIGNRLLNKITKVIKRAGGNGGTTSSTQTTCLHGQNGKALYVEMDTEKINELTEIPSKHTGDGENTLLFSKSPKAQLKNKKGYTLDILHRYGKTREEEFLLYLYRSAVSEINTDLFKFLRLNTISVSKTLTLCMRLFIDFAAQLDKYDYIVIDEGPLNTLIHGFFSFFLKNHIMTIPFDDIDIANLIYPQKNDIDSSSSFYRDLLKEIKKMYADLSKDYQPEHNLVIVINERNSTDGKESIIKNYTTSKYYERVKAKLSEFEKTFSEKSGISVDNIIIVLLPFYWQAYLDENKSDRVVLPLIATTKGKTLNEPFKIQIEYLDHILSELAQGKTLAEIKKGTL